MAELLFTHIGQGELRISVLMTRSGAPEQAAEACN